MSPAAQLPFCSSKPAGASRSQSSQHTQHYVTIVSRTVLHAVASFERSLATMQEVHGMYIPVDLNDTTGTWLP
jgi:hypothetical protein